MRFRRFLSAPALARPLLALAALAGVAAPGCASTSGGAPTSGPAATQPGDEAAARAAVTASLDRLHAAWNAHDMVAFGAVFVEDASFVNILGHRMHGRADIIERHQKIHQGHFRDSTLTPLATDVRLLGDGVAIAVVEWRLENARDPRTDQPVEPSTGFMTTTLREQAGAWHIVALHNTRTLPMPGPQPPGPNPVTPSE